MKPICTIILAAGKGTRLKSEKPKVMHEILGLPLIFYPINLALKFSSGIICVVGHGRESVGPYLDQYP
ncbi:bifunctional N-acetylglucosamine-1-phosphate uridyltransferase/glucosamine-1-phosphate acetyltransferase, partial [archaeon]|nr:bifunctional N-acetylglucosamine-1-phosphate uridyltransferase/glucosamine-1-phosphate acetyltransferase [archaeon]